MNTRDELIELIHEAHRQRWLRVVGEDQIRFAPLADDFAIAVADVIIAAGWRTREMWEASQRLDKEEDWSMTWDAHRQKVLAGSLKDWLRAIDKADHEVPPDYDLREQLVYLALSTAKGAGIECGFRIDPSETEWPVAYIELPTGQVSWHMPQHPREYDRHTSEQKYERIAAWLNES
jgi:hypothetical protein